MDLSPDTNKEYIWCAKLDKTKKVHQWGGQDDGSLEQIVLKKACLGVGAVENERNIIQVTSFNHKAEKIEVCICSLRAGLKEDETLSDLTILPPAVFKLVAGSGPVHIVANHMTLSDYLASDDESDMSEDISNDEMNEEEEEEEAAVKAIKSLAKAQKKAEASFDDDEEDDDDDDDDFDDGEDEEDDDDDEFEDEISEEEPEVKTPSKKRKAEEKSKVNGEGKKKKGEENLVTPKKQDSKKTPKKEPKTPLQQKENKTPVSAKKTPKSYSSVAELLAAIKKYPGGKPKKEEKFSNWVKHTFKVSNDEWVKKLWKAHKADLGQ